MKTWIAQIEVYPSEIQKNLASAISHLEKAKEANAEVVVFPEMCLTGYIIGDLWEEENFLEDAKNAGQSLEVKAKELGLWVIYGNVFVDDTKLGEDGRQRRYNAGFVSSPQQGRIRSACGLECFPKALMPNYREFDDTRYFFDLRKLAQEKSVSVESLLEPVEISVESGSYKLGIQLCEDGWDRDYSTKPTQVLVSKGAEFVFNLSASPFTKGKAAKRDRVFSEQAQSLGCTVVYVNQVGVQNNGKTFYVFDGDSSVWSANGKRHHFGSFFESGGFFWDSQHTESKVLEACPEVSYMQALQKGLKNYLNACGLTKAVIGASGGIDSAVNASLFVSVLGPENVLLVNMPSKYNSELTKGLAADLANNLGCWQAIVPIGDSVALTHSQIHGLKMSRESSEEVLSLSDFHMENVQARDRSSRILAALSSAFGGVFTCNANKAEMMVGYSTLYGDHGGFMAPLGDLWKDEVYGLGRLLDEHHFKRQVIPEGIYDIVPSAELSDKQDVTQGQGDPMTYWYHDRLFAYWIESWNRKGPEGVLEALAKGELEKELGLEKPWQEAFLGGKSELITDLERWWKLFRGMAVAKRIQSPPVVCISKRSFGFDYRESLIPVYFSEKYCKLKEKILSE